MARKLFLSVQMSGVFFVLISHMLQIKELCIHAKIASPRSKRYTRNTDCVLLILLFAHMMCFLVPSAFLLLLILTQIQKKSIILKCIPMGSR